MEWITGACAAAKAAKGMVQSLLMRNLDSELAVKIAEIKGVLLVLESQLKYAREDQVALAYRIVDLEAEIARYERWKQK